MNAPETLPDLLTEQEAYKRFGNVLGVKELRAARQGGLIGFYERKRKILYRLDELEQFVIKRLAESYTCPSATNLFSNLATTGLTELPAQADSIASGMTEDLEKSAAAHLRRQISKPQRSPSRRSSFGKGLATPASRATSR